MISINYCYCFISFAPILPRSTQILMEKHKENQHFEVARIKNTRKINFLITNKYQKHKEKCYLQIDNVKNTQENCYL